GGSVRAAASSGGSHRGGSAGRRVVRSARCVLTRRVEAVTLPRFFLEKHMQRSRIIGTGTYLPARRVTNDDLAKEFGIDTTDAWIRERTGIGARRIAAAGEATSDMATAAARKALEMANVSPEELDMIVIGTVTPDMPFPSAAAVVQAKLGAKKAACFDVSA